MITIQTYFKAVKYLKIPQTKYTTVACLFVAQKWIANNKRGGGAFLFLSTNFIYTNPLKIFLQKLLHSRVTSRLWTHEYIIKALFALQPAAADWCQILEYKRAGLHRNIWLLVVSLCLTQARPDGVEAFHAVSRNKLLSTINLQYNCSYVWIFISARLCSTY